MKLNKGYQELMHNIFLILFNRNFEFIKQDEKIKIEIICLPKTQKRFGVVKHIKLTDVKIFKHDYLNEGLYCLHVYWLYGINA